MKADFHVSMELPAGVTKAEAREYIQTAIASWKGGGDPEELIYDLDTSKITVKSIRKVPRNAQVR